MEAPWNSVVRAHFNCNWPVFLVWHYKASIPEKFEIRQILKGKDIHLRVNHKEMILGHKTN